MTVFADDGYGAWTSRSFSIEVVDTDPNETIQANFTYFNPATPKWNQIALENFNGQAEGWDTKLLGRGPDHRPMPTLLHWELSDEGGLMLSSSEEIAARGAVFLYVAPAEVVGDVHGREARRGEQVLDGAADDDVGTAALLRCGDERLLQVFEPARRPELRVSGGRACALTAGAQP